MAYFRRLDQFSWKAHYSPIISYIISKKYLGKERRNEYRVGGVITGWRAIYIPNIYGKK